METVNIYAAKARLSELVDRAAAGEDVIISRHGKPVARLTQLAGAKRQVRFGVRAGKVSLSPDFDAPLPADVQAGFEAG